MCYVTQRTIVYADGTRRPVQQITHCSRATADRPCDRAQIIPLNDEMRYHEMPPPIDMGVAMGSGMGADIQVIQPTAGPFHGLAQAQTTRPSTKGKEKQKARPRDHYRLEWNWHIPFTSKDKKGKGPKQSEPMVHQSPMRPTALAGPSASPYGQPIPSPMYPPAAGPIPVPPPVPQPPPQHGFRGSGYHQPTHPQHGHHDSGYQSLRPAIIEVTPRNTPPASPNYPPPSRSRSHSGPHAHVHVETRVPRARRGSSLRYPRSRSRSQDRDHDRDRPTVYRQHERRTSSPHRAAPRERSPRRYHDRHYPDRRAASPRPAAPSPPARPRPRERSSSRRRHADAREAEARARESAIDARIAQLVGELEENRVQRERAARTQARAEEIARLDAHLGRLTSQLDQQRRTRRGLRTVVHHDSGEEELVDEGYDDGGVGPSQPRGRGAGLGREDSLGRREHGRRPARARSPSVGRGNAPATGAGGRSGLRRRATERVQYEGERRSGWRRWF